MNDGRRNRLWSEAEKCRFPAQMCEWVSKAATSSEPGSGLKAKRMMLDGLVLSSLMKFSLSIPKEVEWIFSGCGPSMGNPPKQLSKRLPTIWHLALGHAEGINNFYFIFIILLLFFFIIFLLFSC